VEPFPLFDATTGTGQATTTVMTCAGTVVHGLEKSADREEFALQSMVVGTSCVP
jgi:hypothetical protein